jgi:hypothetical protein
LVAIREVSISLKGLKEYGKEEYILQEYGK